MMGGSKPQVIKPVEPVEGAVMFENQRQFDLMKEKESRQSSKGSSRKYTVPKPEGSSNGNLSLHSKRSLGSFKEPPIESYQDDLNKFMQFCSN